MKANSNSRHQAMTLGLSVAVILSSLFSVAAQSNPQRIRFARSHSSTTISGRIAGFDTKDYVVGASAGQEMTVRLKSSNPGAYFVIYSINGRATEMNETTEWSERLSESGDYLIRVFMMRSAARRKGAVASYTLSVAIR
ncbi:MAG TPA: hypothetical protein VEM96_04070 [Pyrinomonadaceae bacterium]|nr:hypothetical protein [Pyrinomonadaceae bacterium]